MRIVSYNLYEGAQDTYEQLQEFVLEQQPDVVCLQEANGWDQGTPSRMRDFGRSVGLSMYRYGDTNTRFKLATFSRLPILASEMATEGFWHGALRTSFKYHDGVIDVWNAHLSPRDEDQRDQEAAWLLQMTDPRYPVVITGDYNSLSAA